MSFLNDLSQKINDVGQTTIKKTKNLADTAKLNLNISEEERKITAAYEEIGKWYVNKHRDDADPEIETWLETICAAEKKIHECRESIHQMKGMVLCPACGASVDADAAFCSACGQKMPEKPQPQPVKEEEVDVIPPEKPESSETAQEETVAAPEEAAQTAEETSETPEAPTCVNNSQTAEQ